MRLRGRDQRGVTLIELIISLTVFMIIIIGVFAMYNALVNSALVAKRQAVALTLATNQMEYLKSLPYDSLAVAGGSIYSASPLPATSTQTINGIKYNIKTSINYVDDAYDGCANYPDQQLKEKYCRSYPPPTGSPSPDTNPQDYKVAHVSVKDRDGLRLAEVDTQISARVSETASTTGAMFVSVTDGNGNNVSGATVNVSNTTTTPNINLNDTTDNNGIAIFYGLPPDSNNFDYTLTGSKSGYSTLSTIVPSGTLTPTYSNQKILTQQSVYVTLHIKPQGTDSLLVETTDISGNPLNNARFNIKGGYKKYTSLTDTQYYYNSTLQTDIGTNTLGISNLVPGGYFFCGDTGTTSCTVGGTTYYLAAAVPYGGTKPLQPIAVPTYDPASPPATVFPYGTKNYLQKVRLMLTTSAAFPRVRTITPYDVSLSGGTASTFSFTIAGNNLPCSTPATSCATTVKLLQGANTFTASCTGDSSGLQMNCRVNLSTAVTGGTQLVITSGGNTLTLPAAPMLGGINVSP